MRPSVGWLVGRSVRCSLKPNRAALSPTASLWVDSSSHKDWNRQATGRRTSRPHNFDGEWNCILNAQLAGDWLGLRGRRACNSVFGVRPTVVI
jgi:hypothetical protein